MNVFILASCPHDELVDYSTLVFKTLRTGFPNGKINVQINTNTALDSVAAITTSANECGTLIGPLWDGNHGEWIQRLVQTNTRPFWVVDTDVIFYDSMEKCFQSGTAMSGTLVPSHHCPYINAWVVSRLHPSVMWIDPVLLRKQLSEKESALPESVFVPRVDWWNPQTVVTHGQLIFYDTMAAVTHATTQYHFRDEDRERFFHFYAGTFSTKVPHIQQAPRNHILNHPEDGRGAWRAQQKYYENLSNSDRQRMPCS